MAMTMIFSVSAFAASGFEFLFQLAGGAGAAIPNKEVKKVFSPIWTDVKHVWTRDIFRDVFMHKKDLRTQTPEDYINNSLYLEAKTFLHGLLVVENNAIIIGKNGQTLRAISNVLKAAVNATFKKRINVIIDVNHYKEDRYRKVKAIANRVAKEVAKSHVDAELDPMPNDERKVIHQYLQDFKHVETCSIGDGNKRHLVIKYKEGE